MLIFIVLRTHAVEAPHFYWTIKMGEKASKGSTLNPRTPLTALHCASLVTSVASKCPYEVSVTQ